MESSGIKCIIVVRNVIAALIWANSIWANIAAQVTAKGYFSARGCSVTYGDSVMMQ